MTFWNIFRNMDFCGGSQIFCWSFAGYIRTETMQKFQPERQIGKIEETKTEKRHTERIFCTSFKIRNQPPVIWLSDKTAEVVKADD